jgi:DnaJ-class molecular chaperone
MFVERVVVSILLLLAHDAMSLIAIARSGYEPRVFLKTSLSAQAKSKSEKLEDNFLLQEFAVASGEVINPYEVLKVSRKATREEIRASYLTQSRRYHPDGNRHRTMLPGSCNSIDDVRDQWERIKLSYEILSNPKTRKRYDRHEGLADPKAAMQRAAMNAALDGISSVGKGVVGIGMFAFQAVTKKSSKNHHQVEE